MCISKNFPERRFSTLMKSITECLIDIVIMTIFMSAFAFPFFWLLELIFQR